MTIMFVTYMVGYAVGWWRSLWGGTVMILAALIVILPFIILGNNFGSLIFGVPQLVIGSLYLSLYRSEKRGNVRGI